MKHNILLLSDETMEATALEGAGFFGFDFPGFPGSGGGFTIGPVLLNIGSVNTHNQVGVFSIGLANFGDYNTVIVI